jgi:thiopurine S-methyltransferase
LEPEEWLQRWREGRIGFHRATVQPWLAAHVARLAPNGDECILVPLCGKSVDLVWLEARGYSVVGVELAEQAARAFLAEQGRVASERRSPPFLVFATGRIELRVGDFFAFDPARLGDFPAIYDRAALVAMPAERRGDYAARLLSLLRPGGRLLLVGMEYDETKYAGPPFSVPRDEVVRRFGPTCDVEPLGAKSLLDDEPVWRERGLDALTEYALLLTRRA